MYSLKAFGIMFVTPAILGISIGYLSAEYMSSKESKPEVVPKDCVAQICPVAEVGEKVSPFKSNDGDKVIWP